MMSFIGVGIAQMLIKGPFQDPSVNIAQTKVLPLDKMLPHIPGTKIHIGVLVALIAAFVLYYVSPVPRSASRSTCSAPTRGPRATSASRSAG